MIKPGKESARNCARALLAKVIERDLTIADEIPSDVSYTVDEIENAIFKTYPYRETYLAKIAKIALHLSVYTRTGRVSWTFQNAIFNRGETNVEGKISYPVSGSGQEDYLEWLLSRATDEDVFPELYKSRGYVEELDRQNFETQMRLEHDAILNGLREIVRVCCDSGTCKLADMSKRYDEELFKVGSIFETAARAVCIARKVDFWVPPGKDVVIPDSTPIYDRSIELGERAEVASEKMGSSLFNTTDDLPLVSSQDRSLIPPGLTTSEPIWRSAISSSISSPSSLTTSVKEELKPTEEKISEDRKRSIYISQRTTPDIHRNFDLTGQITCFDVSNLIHNLAVLEPGKLLELPWDGSLLDGDIQDELYDRFRVEIGMRRYYLASYYL